MPSGVKGFSLWLHGKSTETLEEVLLPVCHWLPPPFAPGSLRSICTGAAADLRPASLLWDNPADFQPNCTRWSTKAEMQRGCQGFSLSVSLLAALSFVSTNYTNFSKWFIDAKLLHTFLFKLFVWSIVLLEKRKKDWLDFVPAVDVPLRVVFVHVDHVEYDLSRPMLGSPIGKWNILMYGNYIFTSFSVLIALMWRAHLLCSTLRCLGGLSDFGQVTVGAEAMPARPVSSSMSNVLLAAWTLLFWVSEADESQNKGSLRRRGKKKPGAWAMSRVRVPLGEAGAATPADWWWYVWCRHRCMGLRQW